MRWSYCHCNLVKRLARHHVPQNKGFSERWDLLTASLPAGTTGKGMRKMCPPIPYLTSKLKNWPKKWYLFFTSHLNMIWSTDSSVSHEHLSCVFMSQAGQFFTCISIFVSCRNSSALQSDRILWTWDLNPSTYQFSAVTAGIKIFSVLFWFFFFMRKRCTWLRHLALNGWKC